MTRNFAADRINDGEGANERAARIGIAYRTLMSLEANPGSMPSTATAKKVADFYGVKVTDLWPLDTPELAA